MTLEEKQARVLELIYQAGNIAKLIRNVIVSNIYTTAEEDLDKMITTMEAE